MSEREDLCIVRELIIRVLIFFCFAFVAVDFQGSLGKVSSASVQHPRQMVDLTIVRNAKAPEQVCVIANYPLLSALF